MRSGVEGGHRTRSGSCGHIRGKGRTVKGDAGAAGPPWSPEGQRLEKKLGGDQLESDVANSPSLQVGEHAQGAVRMWPARSMQKTQPAFPCPGRAWHLRRDSERATSTMRRRLLSGRGLQTLSDTWLIP